MRMNCNTQALLILFFLSLITFNLSAQGDLLIFPKRIVFEGTRNRVQTLNLNNSGTETTTYRISYIEIKMDVDGKFQKITEPDSLQYFASPYLRFFPRSITLAPKETQVIKIQLTKTGELQPGEYRSHLYIQALPKEDALESPKKGKTEGIKINLTPIYGISIANIIRVGNPNAEVTIENTSFEKFKGSIPIVSMDFRRKGNASVYGDIIVKHISPDGKETEVAKMKGFAVYTPGSLRKTRIKLLAPEEINYNSGTLKISYYSQKKPKEKFAEATLDL
ncbi:molecular chaperone [Christiangramia fulva]|nr:molecular chaperone [Christiangramia fulva]